MNSIVPLLQDVQLKHPIEQHMLGRGGLFQQNNVEKRRTYSVREWSELCNSDGLKPPSRQELEAATGRGARAVRRQPQPKERATSTPLSEPKPDDEPAHLATPPASVADTHDEDEDDEMEGVSAASPPKDEPVSLPTPPGLNAPLPTEELDKKAAARAAKVARVAARQAQDDEWLKNFDPATHWLPDGMRAEDYTPEFCKLLERHYWRNCGLGKPPMYGADMQGTCCSRSDCVDRSVMNIQDHCSRTKSSTGMSLRYPLHYQDYCPLPRAFPGSTLRICTGECGVRHLRGMSR